MGSHWRNEDKIAFLLFVNVNRKRRVHPVRESSEVRLDLDIVAQLEPEIRYQLPVFRVRHPPDGRPWSVPFRSVHHEIVSKSATHFLVSRSVRPLVTEVAHDVLCPFAWWQHRH